jgi:hypothetical protein
MVHMPSFRLVALLLVVVLLLVAGTPARVEAIEPLTLVAIAGLAVAGIVLIAYLIIANVEGGRSASEGRTVWVACAAADCVPVPAATAAALMRSAAEVADPQGP